MKTLLVLTDFSEAATHAAKYAAIVAKQLKATKIILFYKLPAITSIASSPLVVKRSNESKEEAILQLKRLVNELRFLKHSNTELSYLVKEGQLDLLTNGLIHKYQVDYVVMGLTGKSKLEQTLIGSNTIQVAKTVQKPLLIVPESCKLNPISKVVSVLDLFDLKQAQVIHNLLSPMLPQSQPELFVLSYESESIAMPYHKHNFTAAKNIIAPYHPAFFSINEMDIVNEVLNFSRAHDISLILHIEKKRNLFENLFSIDMTERIAYVSHIPVLLGKEG